MGQVLIVMIFCCHRLLNGTNRFRFAVCHSGLFGIEYYAVKNAV
jgi:hypothetical protein